MQHQARKRFGQNFLHDPMVIQRIINAINPKKTEHLIEIGPGMGALTEQLIFSVEQLDVIEIDRDLIPQLQRKYTQPNFHIHQADALKFDFKELKQSGKKMRVIGNLPYNISTPLLFHLLSYAEYIQDMHFMLQKEVVDRLAAQPGTESYGRLSVMMQYFCKVEKLFVVKPGAFRPAPKVESAIVRLIPYVDLPYAADDFNRFSEIVRLAFIQRRKTLRNSLRDILTPMQIQAAQLSDNSRPEELTVQDFVNLSKQKWKL